MSVFVYSISHSHNTHTHTTHTHLHPDPVATTIADVIAVEQRVAEALEANAGMGITNNLVFSNTLATH